MLSRCVAVLATSIRFQASPLGLRMSVEGPLASSKIDERLRNIDVARHNLQEALHAIEGLKFSAEQNKRELDATLERITEAESRKTDLGAELDTLATIAKLDVEMVRRALGIPTRRVIWLQRVAAFFVGVATSLTATFLWAIVI